MSNVYILIEWPDSQDFMEEDWFEDEAILATPREDDSLSSAYFIPKNRYDSMTKLSYEDWYALNEEEINIELSELGATMELNFDSDKIFEERYEEYLNN